MGVQNGNVRRPRKPQIGASRPPVGGGSGRSSQFLGAFLVAGHASVRVAQRHVDHVGYSKLWTKYFVSRSDTQGQAHANVEPKGMHTRCNRAAEGEGSESRSPFEPLQLVPKSFSLPLTLPCVAPISFFRGHRQGGLKACERPLFSKRGAHTHRCGMTHTTWLPPRCFLRRGASAA